MQGYINVVRLRYWHYILYKIRKIKNFRKIIARIY
jgi:hypothetical protein